MNPEADKIIALNGVEGRNATSKLSDPETLYAVIRAERAGKNRVIVLDAAKKRLRGLGVPDEPPSLPVSEKVKATRKPKTPRTPVPTGEGITEGTCSLCRRAAHTHADVVAIFGLRTMPTKSGEYVRRRQPRCKACRTGKLGRKAVPAAEPS